MKIVLDTNCLLPIVIPNSYCWSVWQAFVSGDYTLCVSTEILLEYREILERQYESAEFAEMVLSAITNAENVEYVEPAFRFNLIQADKDDNKYLKFPTPVLSDCGIYNS